MGYSIKQFQNGLFSRFHDFHDLLERYGCNDTDYIRFPKGNIALVIRGNCTVREKYGAARRSGAVAIMVSCVTID